MRRTNRLLIAILTILAAPLLAMGQDQPKVPELDDITISPSRLEMIMPPGTEKTVTVNLVYSKVTGKAPPTRLLAYLGDWDISKEGKIGFYKAGTRPNSASPWIIYSPTEGTVESGQTHQIRVTVSVPKDATPGDHLAVLLVEPRLGNMKLAQNQKQVQMKFRLASIFYIMVPALTQKGSLEGLRAEATQNGIIVTPKLMNEGNSHVRPTHSVKVIDQSGVIVAEMKDVEALPVLASSEMEMPVLLEKVVPPGNYLVRYKVDFGGQAITEGETELVVKPGVAQKSVTSSTTATSAKPQKDANE